MVKKFLLSAAVVGALATSAMAYNVSELKLMAVGGIAAGSANPVNIANDSNPLTNRGFKQTQLSNALIFPAFNVGNGWESTVRVINPDPAHAVVAKVVLYDGKDSHEIRDFNIYLSANDVWTGTIKVDSDGVAKIISTDDSTPLEDGTLASADKPFSKSIDSNFGYIEVIAMAVTDGKSGADHDHAGLRTAYSTFAKMERTGSTNPNIVFQNGVIKNQVATSPYIKLKLNNATMTLTDTVNGLNNTAYASYIVDADSNTKNYDKTKEYGFTAPVAGGSFLGLTGDIRITDTVNGKDMDMMPYKIDYATGTAGAPDSLVYIEGEKANIADVFIRQRDTNGDKIDDANIYDSDSLENEIGLISLSNYYITYGDAEVQNMYALLTNPFKRVYVQAKLDDASSGNGGDDEKGQISPNIKITDSNTNPAYYKDASTDASGNINYGSTSLIAQIYDESENAMSAGQFSPANTPTIKLDNEVASTGNDATNKDQLAYYLNQAEAKGYKKGFVKLTNVNNSTTNPVQIPGFMTQMLATTAGGKVVTNWIIPQGN